MQAGPLERQVGNGAGGSRSGCTGAGSDEPGESAGAMEAGVEAAAGLLAMVATMAERRCELSHCSAVVRLDALASHEASSRHLSMPP